MIQTSSIQKQLVLKGNRISVNLLDLCVKSQQTALEQWRCFVPQSVCLVDKILFVGDFGLVVEFPVVDDQRVEGSVGGLAGGGVSVGTVEWRKESGIRQEKCVSNNNTNLSPNQTYTNSITISNAHSKNVISPHTQQMQSKQKTIKHTTNTPSPVPLIPPTSLPLAISLHSTTKSHALGCVLLGSRVGGGRGSACGWIR